MEFGFLIKKIITFFIEPFGIVFVAFLIGLYFLYTKRDNLAKKIITSAFGLLFLFSYAPFSSFLIKNLENQYSKYDYTHNVRYIHVLGGEYKRAIEGVLLYKRIAGSKLIFTGYAGDNNITSAQKNKMFAISFGVKKEDIILGEFAKDTKEEALFTKELLNNEPFVLVTTASHMPRAMKLFRSLGLNPIAAPTNFTKKCKGFFTVPSLGYFYKSQIAMHEYFGILWSILKS